MSQVNRKAARISAGALFAAAFAAVGIIGSAPVAAGDLQVQYDQVMMQPLDEPAANIIIGNPSIADVTLQNNKMLVITGKTFGITNLIVLNADEKVILNERLMVRSDDRKVVSLIRGGLTSTYNCAPKCEPVLKVGDDKDYYSNIAASASQKMKISESGDSGAGTN